MAPKKAPLMIAVPKVKPVKAKKVMSLLAAFLLLPSVS